MCFSVQASLIAWLIADAIAIYLWVRDRRYDRWNAVFIITFSLIQLMEAGLWRSLQVDSAMMNAIITSLIPLALLAQPLVQSYMGYRFTGSVILLSIAVLVIAIIIGTIVRIATTPLSSFQSTIGEHGHLVWNDDTMPNSNIIGGPFIGFVYLIGVLIPLFWMGWRGIPLLIVAVVTAGWCWYIAGSKEFSSYWCYTAVAYALVALFID